MRTEEPDFPFDVLREAIANAIIHRDYMEEKSTNYLYISSEKIILRSPGGPVTPLTLKDLQSFDAGSLSRNPKIMYIFNQMKLSEQRGIGLRNMGKLPDLGYPLPLLEVKIGNLEITFGRTKSYFSPNKEIDAALSEQDRKGLIYIQAKKEVSASDFAKHFKLNAKTAQRRIGKLMDRKLVMSVGSGRWTKYRVMLAESASEG